MWWALIPALVGGALSIAGHLTGRAQRKQAFNDAVKRGAENLREGQILSAQNASQLAQDNMYVLSLSGVSANEGTASQAQNQIKLQSAATINKMSRDFDDYVAQLAASDKADAWNTAFSVAGDVFATVGRIAYDNARIKANSGLADIAPAVGSYLSPDLRINEQWVTPLGARRMGSLTAPTPSFNASSPTSMPSPSFKLEMN